MIPPAVAGRFAQSLPIVERELRISARGKAAYRWRIAGPLLGLALMALVALSSGDRVPATVQGRMLFETLTWISAIYVVLASLTLTADTVSREKREGTLGLLFLTNLRGWDIIAGKLAASSLNLIYGLIGMIPLLAIPVMLGGVSIADGVATSLAVLNLLFVSLAIGILISTLNWDERRATFYTVVGGLIFLLAPALLGALTAVLFGGSAYFAMGVGLFSPVFPVRPYLVQNNSLVIAVLCLLPSHLTGWFMLWAAGRLVRRVWHSRSGAPVRRTVDERVFAPRNPEARAGSRKRLLDVHPLIWLLERHRGKQFYADGLVVSIMVIWAWAYRSYGTEMFGGPSWFLILPLAILIHVILAAWVVAETSVRLIEDRRSGALELLLCTSLTDAELIRGHRLALRRLFARPVALLALAEVYVAFYGFGPGEDADARRGRALMLGLAAALILDTQALSWIGLRLAMSLPTVNRVGALALMITPGLPLLFYYLLAALMPDQFVMGATLRFQTRVLIWLGLVVLVDVAALWFCRRSVVRRFRDEAARAQPKAVVAA